MPSDLLFFKSKKITGTDLEIIFHKEYPWILTQKPLPVVYYKLLNCKNASEIEFEKIDHLSDGVTIEINKGQDQTVFEISDQYDVKTRIFCDSVINEEIEYRKEDLIDLINELTKQRDDQYISTSVLKDKIEKLKQFLNHELDMAERKLNQASWINANRKEVVTGKIEILKQIQDLINKV